MAGGWLRRTAIGQFRCAAGSGIWGITGMAGAIAAGLISLAPAIAADGDPLSSRPSPTVNRDGATVRLVMSQVQSDERTQRIVLEIPLHGQATLEDVIGQVEARVQQALVQQFQSAAGGSAQAVERVQVMVLGNRNGTVVPMVSVMVSRAQWQQQPQAKAWLQVYASQALLQPPPEPLTVAIAPSDAPSTTPSALSTGQLSGVGMGSQGAIGNPPTRAAAIHQAFEDGRLTGAAAQDYLNDLD